MGFFCPSGTAALPSKPAGRLAKPSAWQWPCRSASRCWTSFLRLTVGVAFLWKSCAFLLVKKQPCNRPGGRLPFAARGKSLWEVSFCTHSGLGTREWDPFLSFRLLPHFVLTFSSNPPFLFSTAVLLFFGDVRFPLGVRIHYRFLRRR